MVKPTGQVCLVLRVCWYGEKFNLPEVMKRSKEVLMAKFLPEVSFGSRKPAHDGAFGDFQSLGNFSVRAFFKVEHQNHDAEFIGKIRNCRL